MFAQAEGATALREDLVRALSLSVDVAEPDDWGRCCAALGAVWNGRKGFVAVLVRSIDRAALRRYVLSDPVTSPETLASAVDEGIAFAESMGFTMDHPEFVELSPDHRAERLGIWNRIRKLELALQHLPGLDADGAAEKRAVVPKREFVERWDLEPDGAGGERRPASPGDAAAPADPEADLDGWDSARDAPQASADAAPQPSAGDAPPKRGVLGRLALVRRGGDAQGADAMGRLLAYF